MTSTPTMQIAQINGAKLGFVDKGTGEPLVFIHGAGSLECHAVLQQPALTDRFRLVHNHRRGYGESDPREGPTSLALEAADCRAVLDYLGVEKAHFAAESSGGVVLLQFVRDYPDMVHSMALLEPALPEALNRSSEFNETMARAGEAAERGDFKEAAHVFYQQVVCPDYREVMDPNLPDGWLDQMAREMDAVGKESQAMDVWQFSATDAARITCPVLNVVSSNPQPFMVDAHNTIRDWIPHAENVVLPDSYHCILEGNPGPAASLLAEFFSRHPISKHSEQSA
jgi:pimeloyl-ACP methyl ester carboxylesterase